MIGEVSSMPSRRLEQLAHILGLRDNAFPFRDMGSPQQMHTRGFTPMAESIKAPERFQEKHSLQRKKISTSHRFRKL